MAQEALPENIEEFLREYDCIPFVYHAYHEFFQPGEELPPEVGDSWHALGSFVEHALQAERLFPLLVRHILGSCAGDKETGKALAFADSAINWLHKLRSLSWLKDTSSLKYLLSLSKQSGVEGIEVTDDKVKSVQSRSQEGMWDVIATDTAKEIVSAIGTMDVSLLSKDLVVDLWETFVDQASDYVPSADFGRNERSFRS